MLELIKENEKGKTYCANGFKFLSRFKNSVFEDNSINVHKLFYLVEGFIEVTIDDSVECYEAPAEFEILEKTYHKINSLTNSTMIMFEK